MRAEELARLERAIKDFDIRMRTLQSSITAVDDELSRVNTFKETIESNIKCLKTQKIIAIAQEYKKIKEELKRVENRITQLSNDREYFRKSLMDMDLMLKVTQKELEKLKDSLENNIIVFRPRG